MNKCHKIGTNAMIKTNSNKCAWGFPDGKIYDTCGSGPVPSAGELIADGTDWFGCGHHDKINVRRYTLCGKMDGNRWPAVYG